MRWNLKGWFSDMNGCRSGGMNESMDQWIIPWVWKWMN